jgi:hypothetical protein
MSYHEWGRRGPPAWIAWALVATLCAVIISLLVWH